MTQLPDYMAISIQRWENDAAWLRELGVAPSDTPWRSLRKDLLYLRVREPSFVLRHFGIDPESLKAIEMVRAKMAYLLMSERDRDEIMAGNYAKLIEALYEPNAALDAKMEEYRRGSEGTPDFVVENQRRFAEKGLRAFR